MPGYIEDRWLKKRPDPATGNRERTALWGKGKRYRVAGIPGVRDRSFERKADADAWLADAQSKSRAGEFVDPRRGDLLLREYIEGEWWPGQTGDPATLETIKGRVWTHIVPRLGEMPLNIIRVPQLRVWLKGVGEDIGPGTINAVWGYLSSILQAAVEDERIPKNPCKSKTVRPPKQPERKARAWPRDRVLAVREGLTPRFRLAVDLGIGCGLRQGEVFGLAVDDIDETAGVLHVRRQVKKVHGKLVFAPPKGGKTRQVPLPRHLAARVVAHLEEFPAKKVTLPWVNPDEPETDKQAREWAPRTAELVSTSTQGYALRRESFNAYHWKKALVAAGVIPAPPKRERGRKGAIAYEPSPENGFHALRHTFASVQLDAREPIVSVSKWLGHADPSITLRIYAHMMPEADGRGRAAMDAWFEGQS